MDPDPAPKDTGDRLACGHAAYCALELVRRCDGLDSADPKMASCTLDLHKLGLKNIIHASDDSTRIVCSTLLHILLFRKDTQPPLFSFLY